MAIADSHGLPLSVSTHEASRHEVKLVEKTLSKRLIKTKPQRVIGDKAYDSDKLDKMMKGQRIKMIAPHKENRKTKSTQDGREPRRYKKRWKVESLFTWIKNFRRCNTRYELK